MQVHCCREILSRDTISKRMVASGIASIVGATALSDGAAWAAQGAARMLELRETTK